MSEILEFKTRLTVEEREERARKKAEFDQAYNKQLVDFVSKIYLKSNKLDIYNICEVIFDEVKKRCKYDWDNYKINKLPDGTVIQKRIEISYKTSTGETQRIECQDNSQAAALMYGKSYCYGFQMLVNNVFELLNDKYNLSIKFACPKSKMHAWNTVKIGDFWYKFDTSGVNGDDYRNNFRKITSTDEFDIAEIIKKYPEERDLLDNVFLANNRTPQVSDEQVLKLEYRGDRTPQASEEQVLKLEHRGDRTPHVSEEQVLKLEHRGDRTPQVSEEQVLTLRPKNRIRNLTVSDTLNDGVDYILRRKNNKRLTIISEYNGRKK